MGLHLLFHRLRWSFKEKPPDKNWLFEIWSLFTQIRTYGAQNIHKAPTWQMYHNHFHPLYYKMRQWSTTPLRYTMLKLIYANIAQDSLQALSLEGGFLLWPWWGHHCLLATSNPFLAHVIIYSPKKMTLMAEGKIVYNSHLMMSPKQGPGHSS